MTLLAAADVVGALSAIQMFVYRTLDYLYPGDYQNVPRIYCISVTGGTAIGMDSVHLIFSTKLRSYHGLAIRKCVPLVGSLLGSVKAASLS